MKDLMAQQIESKVKAALQTARFELLNESDRHAGPATDSHYSMTVVSDVFSGLSAVKRHQQIYRLLAEELAGPVHALALHLYTEQEWIEKGETSPDSPDCRGGSH